jgi:putative transposase
VSTWQDEHQRWQGRDLRAKRYLYVWADGVYFSPRLQHEHQCVLVLIGADANAKKELLAIDDGFRESAQSWHELLVRLRDENRLVIDPALATGDRALGFWKPAMKVWPTTHAQRCWVHKTGNVLSFLPKSVQPKAKSRPPCDLRSREPGRGRGGVRSLPAKYEAMYGMPRQIAQARRTLPSRYKSE